MQDAASLTQTDLLLPLLLLDLLVAWPRAIAVQLESRKAG